MKTKEEIISEVIDLNPYKVAGNPDSYSKYNEGWADGCDIMSQKLSEFNNQEITFLKSEISRLKQRLADCERKLLTGERI